MPAPRMPIRFGVELPHRLELLGPAAVRVEVLGFDSIWIGDHVAIHRPTLDPLGALSYLAGLTRRVRIGPGVVYFAVPPGRLLEQLERFGTEVRAVVADWAEPSPSLAAPWRA
jgi:alkanesulfonate monooxygenase SsuD/methylene tetrahydromethanopterin reductase-like flavin-dependent oxidoreductase (luciferase family)